MTSTNSRIVRLVVRLGVALREAGKAQEQLWEAHLRLDPDPWEELHWAPTASGWRLHGSRLPDAGRGGFSPSSRPG